MHRSDKDTHNVLGFQHASQRQGTRNYMKEDEDIHVAVVESIRLMALIHLL